MRSGQEVVGFMSWRETYGKNNLGFNSRRTKNHCTRLIDVGITPANTEPGLVGGLPGPQRLLQHWIQNDGQLGTAIG